MLLVRSFPCQPLSNARKQAVNSQSQELQALEARLRETEERLIEQQSRTSSPAGRGANGTSSPHRRQPLSRAFSGQENDRQSPTTHLLPTQASAPQAVSSSTMSRWRPSQGASSEIHSGTTRTAPFDRQSVYQHSPPSN